MSRLTTGLLGRPGCNEFAGVDYRQRVGGVAALEVQRLILGAVDMNHLTRVQGYPNTRCGATTGVSAIPHHDVHTAVATICLVKGDNALAANRRENGLVRPDRPKVLRKFIGECGNTRYGQGEGACRSEPQEPVSSERIHRKSPSRLRPKTILSLRRFLHTSSTRR